MSNLLQIQTKTKRHILEQSKIDEIRPWTRPEPALAMQAVSCLRLGRESPAVQGLTELSTVCLDKQLMNTSEGHKIIMHFYHGSLFSESDV